MPEPMTDERLAEIREAHARGLMHVGLALGDPVGDLGAEVDRLRALAKSDPRDLHARWHDEPGNLMGPDDCEWEGCEFYSIAVFVLAGGETR